LQDKHIINNCHCHHVGSSKALQSLVFERAGVMSPTTLVLHDKAMLTTAREQMPDGMLKSKDHVQETKLRSALTHICKLADMDVGSVEYLIPNGESAAWLKALGQSN
jgi:hypothetical protein